MEGYWSSCEMLAVTLGQNSRFGTIFNSLAMMVLATLLGPAIGIGVFILLNAQ